MARTEWLCAVIFGPDSLEFAHCSVLAGASQLCVSGEGDPVRESVSLCAMAKQICIMRRGLLLLCNMKSLECENRVRLTGDNREDETARGT
jgi:hypothetical protein